MYHIDSVSIWVLTAPLIMTKVVLNSKIIPTK